jgi:hypothetical protein
MCACLIDHHRHTYSLDSFSRCNAKEKTNFFLLCIENKTTNSLSLSVLILKKRRNPMI